MKKNTEIDFKNGVKAKFELEKLGDYHSFLNNPSPAQLRELCLLKFDNGLNKVDETIFRLYYKVIETGDLRNAIYNYPIEKLKSITNFLVESEKNKSTSILNLNLISVLVNFNPRPFNKFNKSDFSVSEDNFKEDIKTTIPLQKEFKINSFSAAANTGMSSKKTNNKSNNKKAGIVALILTGLFSVGYTTKNMFFKEKECMQWKENHYELVDCKSDNIILTNNCKPEPYNKDEFARKKLKVCDTTTFFKADKPIVWYCKKNKSVCFFNMDGKNPENGAELKQITQHMIDKYVPPLQ